MVASRVPKSFVSKEMGELAQLDRVENQAFLDEKVKRGCRFWWWWFSRFASIFLSTAA
jgi:hypothetical protein